MDAFFPTNSPVQANASTPDKSKAQQATRSPFFFIFSFFYLFVRLSFVYAPANV